jgi:hypothetical protein
MKFTYLDFVFMIPFLFLFFLSRQHSETAANKTRTQRTTMTHDCATPSPNGMPAASIPTMMASIPIPTMLTLTQQSTTLHNGKVDDRREKRQITAEKKHGNRDPINGFKPTARCFSPSTCRSYSIDTI